LKMSPGPNRNGETSHRRRVSLLALCVGLIGLCRAETTFPDPADEDPILSPVMEEDWRILADRAKLAARRDSEEARAQLRRALPRAINMAAQGDGTHSMRFSAARIMDAAAACSLPDSGKLVERLLGAEDANVRLAAAYLAAKCGGNRREAIKVLLDALKGGRGVNQQIAADYQRLLPPSGPDEASAREGTILGTLGTPHEYEALRALVNCAGPRTAERLTPLLNERDFWRGLRVAWVLAHHPAAETTDSWLPNEVAPALSSTAASSGGRPPVPEALPP